jgi:preprotein translocase subunit SecE
MAKTNANAPQQQKKNRISEYCKGVRTELKKVVWPTKNELSRFTVVVLAVCAFFALFFWLLDTGILAIMEQVLNITM